MKNLMKLLTLETWGTDHIPNELVVLQGWKLNASIMTGVLKNAMDKY
jgi:hypothetical protein